MSAEMVWIALLLTARFLIYENFYLQKTGESIYE